MGRVIELCLEQFGLNASAPAARRTQPPRPPCPPPASRSQAAPRPRPTQAAGHAGCARRDGSIETGAGNSWPHSAPVRTEAPRREPSRLESPPASNVPARPTPGSDNWSRNAAAALPYCSRREEPALAGDIWHRRTGAQLRARIEGRAARAARDHRACRRLGRTGAARGRRGGARQSRGAVKRQGDPASDAAEWSRKSLCATACGSRPAICCCG